jgi:hypothetical protein
MLDLRTAQTGREMGAAGININKNKYKEPKGSWKVTAIASVVVLALYIVATVF